MDSTMRRALNATMCMVLSLYPDSSPNKIVLEALAENPVAIQNTLYSLGLLLIPANMIEG